MRATAFLSIRSVADTQSSSGAGPALVWRLMARIAARCLLFGVLRPLLVTARGGRDVLELEFPNRPELLSHIRSRVAEEARKMPFSPEDIEDIVLATGEAASNAMRHGSSGVLCRIAVRMERRPDSLLVVVSDKGCGFDLESVPEPGPDLLSEGGRGIMFMRATMDEVTFHFTRPGTRVELVKRFRPNCAQAW